MRKNQDFLDFFVSQELNSDSKELLLNEIIKCREGSSYSSKDLLFNMFNVSIDGKAKVITIEYELDTRSENEGTYPLEQIESICKDK